MAHVLIADDDDSFRELMRSMVELLGHTATLAADGEQALEKARVSRPDLVLLDIMMPRKGGIETLMTMAAGANRVPVVIVSASIEGGEESTVRLVKRYGAKAVLPKPFNKQQLEDAINGALKR